MSFIEKKVITYSKSTIFIQAMHKLFVQYSGYQVHFESRFKKELKKLLGGIFAKIVLKRTLPCVFYTTPFKWWVILPVLNSFRKKNEIGNIICSQDLLYLCLLFSPLECTFKFNSKTTGTDCILRQVLYVKRLAMQCDLNFKKDIM